MRLTLQAFGIARDICGGSSVELETPDQITVAQLQALLNARYPRLGQLASFLLAVNEEYAQPDQLLSPTDEIVIIPPVSGG